MTRAEDTPQIRARATQNSGQTSRGRRLWTHPQMRARAIHKGKRHKLRRTHVEDTSQNPKFVPESQNSKQDAS